MITLQTALILVLIHLIYYSIFYFWSDVIRFGSVKNTPNKLITKLRGEYKVNIRTFQKNNNHEGFSWFKTIYINESLFNREKRLKHVFFHELYHIQNKHKIKSLAIRFLFPFTLLLCVISGWFIIVYIGYAFVMYKITDNTAFSAYNKSIFDVNAEKYARKMIENV